MSPARAHRNTPQSVLSYIDAMWRKHELPDPLELSRELGFSPKAYRGLKEKHGDELITYLLRVQRARAEEPRFLARQNGRTHPISYIGTRIGAISDAEAVDDATLAQFGTDARERELQSVGELYVVLEELRSAVSERLENNPEARRLMGRDAWALRCKIDSIERRLKRRVA